GVAARGDGGVLPARDTGARSVARNGTLETGDRPPRRPDDGRGHLRRDPRSHRHLQPLPVLPVLTATACASAAPVELGQITWRARGSPVLRHLQRRRTTGRP